MQGLVPWIIVFFVVLGFYVFVRSRRIIKERTK
jgi:hypothetical protein